MQQGTKRASFAIIRKKYKNIGKGNVRLTQSSLVLIQALVATQTVYNFLVLESDQPLLAGEKRLNQNDEFISYDVGYFAEGDEQVGGVPIPTAIRRLCYPPTELNSTFEQLQGIWRGFLSISINKINRLENWDLQRHLATPRSQFVNAAPAAGIPSAGQPSTDYSKDGFYGMQPMVTLSGAKKNEIKVTLDQAVGLGSAGAWTSADGTVIDVTATRLVLMFRGLLAQNASKFQ